MGASLETPNYKLPQYVADDRPSYLGDWNGAMGIIDSGMAENKNDIANNEVAIANMKTYVDNSVAENKTYVDNAVAENKTYVDATVDQLRTDVNTTIDSVNKSISRLENGAIVVFGDSWSDLNPAGSGTWPNHLATITGRTVKSYAVGATGFTLGGSNSFAGQVSKFMNDNNPVFNTVSDIIIMGGLNDFEAGVQYGAIQTALASIVDMIKSVCPQASIYYLPNMYYPYKADQVNNIWRLETEGTGTNQKDVAVCSMFEWFAPNDWNANNFHVTEAVCQSVIPQAIISIMSGVKPANRCIWHVKQTKDAGNIIDYTITFNNYMYYHSYQAISTGAQWVGSIDTVKPAPTLVSQAARFAVCLPNGDLGYAAFSGTDGNPLNYGFVVPAVSPAGAIRYSWNQQAVSLVTA